MSMSGSSAVAGAAADAASAPGRGNTPDGLLRPPTGGGSFAPRPGLTGAGTMPCEPVGRAGAPAAGAAATGNEVPVGRRGAPGNGGGTGGAAGSGGIGGTGTGGRRRAWISLASAGTSIGGFQEPSRSFQTWMSASLGSGAT